MRSNSSRCGVLALLLGQNLEVYRGSRAILSRFSMSICQGEFIALLGPSGAGKSTVMRTLAGLIVPDQGTVTLDTRDLQKWDSSSLARELSLVPQDDILHTSLTVESALTYGAQLRLPTTATTEEVAARVEKVIRLTDMAEHRGKTIRKLSGGQRKRVNVGLELICSPRFLFLDEPTSGLDPALEEQMMKLFHALSREGRGIVVSTHAMGSLEIVDFIALVCEGRLISFAPLRETLTFYGVQHIAEVFKTLRTKTAEQWQQKFFASAMSQECVRQRQKTVTSQNKVVREMADLVAQSQGVGATSATNAISAPKPGRQPAKSDEVSDLLAQLAKEVEREQRGGER